MTTTTLRQRAANIAAFFICLCGFVFLISDKANADQKREIDELRKIVAACLSDSTGRPITIGNETYLCGIVSIGKYP